MGIVLLHFAKDSAKNKQPLIKIEYLKYSLTLTSKNAAICQQIDVSKSRKLKLSCLITALKY